MFGDIVQLLCTRQVVEAHGKKWITLYFIGQSSDDKGRDLFIAVPADSQLPAPCSLITVERPPTPTASSKEQAPSSKTSE